MNILIISNGYGEDLIATNLIKELQIQQKGSEISAIPLVGQGKEFQKLGIKPAVTNKTMPSGGFIRSISDLAKDIGSGLITQIIRQRRAIKKAAKNSDCIICVGDIFCLFQSRTKKIPVYFLPTAKSDLITKHSKIEINLMKKYSKKVFPRDQITADTLKKSGIDTQFYGNPMMDNIQTSENSYNFSKSDQIIGILPGSRQEAYQNLELISDIVKELKKNKPKIKFIIAKADSLDKAKIESIPGLKDQNIVITPIFGDVLRLSNIIIGLAGTANEQAIYAGQKVICFPGKGSQTTHKRFQEQKKLLGTNLILKNTQNPKELAQSVQENIQDRVVINLKNNNVSQKITKIILATSHYKNVS